MRCAWSKLWSNSKRMSGARRSSTRCATWARNQGAARRRAPRDRRFLVWAIYLSGGGGATLPGDCNGLPEATKVRRIVKLRERETRRAWKVLAPNRRVPLRFLRGPDQGLVASSALVDGVRFDVFSPEGEAVIARAVDRFARLPESIASASGGSSTVS